MKLSENELQEFKDSLEAVHSLMKGRSAEGPYFIDVSIAGEQEELVLTADFAVAFTGVCVPRDGLTEAEMRAILDDFGIEDFMEFDDSEDCDEDADWDERDREARLLLLRYKTKLESIREKRAKRIATEQAGDGG